MRCWHEAGTRCKEGEAIAALRLRTAAAKRFKRVDNATAVIWKMLLIAEKRFRRLNVADLIADLFLGAQYVNGVPGQNHPEEAAA